MSENINMPIERNLNWEVRPYQGVGVIDFGMTREEVRKIMKEKYGEEAEEVKKFSEKPICDVYFNSGVWIYYKEGDLVNGVEFWQEIAKLKIQGELIDFTNTHLEEILGKIASLDDTAYEDEKWGYKSPKFGIAFGSVDGENVQSLGVFSKEEFAKFNDIE